MGREEGERERQRGTGREGQGERGKMESFQKKNQFVNVSDHH